MKLVIDRERWLRGRVEESYLRRSDDGRMCCLGFYSLAIGFSEGDIDDVACPNEVCELSTTTEYPDWVYRIPDLDNSHSRDINELMRVNDSQEISDVNRERKIKEIFARHDVEVEFV